MGLQPSLFQYGVFCCSYHLFCFLYVLGSFLTRRLFPTQPNVAECLCAVSANGSDKRADRSFKQGRGTTRATPIIR